MIYEKIIEFGIVFLLIYTPLAFGGVTEYPRVLLETVTGILLLVWLVKIFLQRKQIPRDTSTNPDKPRYYLRLTAMPCFLAIGAFCALIVLQLVPLPASVVSILAPQTSFLYAEAAAHTGASVLRSLPLSVCTQASETELFKFLVYFAVFFLIINTIRRPRQIRRMVSTILTIGLLESVYSLLQLLSGGHLLSFYTKSSWTHGSFINKNHFAGYLEMAILLAFGVLFTRFEPQRSSQRKRFRDPFREKYPKAFLLLLGILVMILALLFSGSRGGLVSLSGGLLFFVLLAHTRRLLRRWLVGLLIVLPLVLITAVLMVPEQFSASLTRFTEQQLDPSFQIRWQIWKTQGDIFRDFPIVGSGFGTFSHLARRYQTFRWSRRLAHSESDIMRLVAETGVAGTGFVLWIVGMFFYRVLFMWKQRRSRWEVAMVVGGLSAIVSLVIHGVFDFNLHIPSNALLLSVIAGLSYVITYTRNGRIIKNRNLALSPALFYSLVLILVTGVVLYTWSAVKTFRAFEIYQNFSRADSAEHDGSIALDLRQITPAIHYDSNHPEYHYALGSYLYQYGVNTHSTQTEKSQKEIFDEAERWLKQAILLDPANPDYYYEMGRLSYDRGDCPSEPEKEQHYHPGDCPAAQYFLAALKNDPKDSFLRTQISRWFYYYDRDTAIQLIQRILTGDAGIVIQRDTDATFAKFLYEIQMDYESDLEKERISQTEKEHCKPHLVLRGEGDGEIGRWGDREMGRGIELGNDDGLGEWRTRLTSEMFRITKIFCLPENLAEYHSAALKILMNRSGTGPLDVTIKLNEHHLPVSDQVFPDLPEWHEIPVELTLLQGQTKLTVYIRTQASAPGTYLQIWGDQDTPNTQSVFNFGQTDDLSPDEGKQTGEYLIRLVLRK